MQDNEILMIYAKKSLFPSYEDYEIICAEISSTIYKGFVGTSNQLGYVKSYLVSVSMIKDKKKYTVYIEIDKEKYDNMNRFYKIKKLISSSFDT